MLEGLPLTLAAATAAKTTPPRPLMLLLLDLQSPLWLAVGDVSKCSKANCAEYGHCRRWLAVSLSGQSCRQLSSSLGLIHIQLGVTGSEAANCSIICSEK